MLDADVATTCGMGGDGVSHVAAGCEDLQKHVMGAMEDKADKKDMLARPVMDEVRTEVTARVSLATPFALRLHSVSWLHSWGRHVTRCAREESTALDNT